MLKHRAISVASVLGMLGSTVLVSTALIATAAPAQAATTCPVFFDVSSPRDRHDDVALGSPLEDVKATNGVKQVDAGSVTVVYGDPAGSGAFGPYDGTSITMNDLGFGSKAGDRFGASLLLSDLNGDGCGDLVIGAPGRNSGSGVVVIVYGQPMGQFTSLVQVLKQGSAGVSGAAEAGDGFGSSLAVTGDGTAGNPRQLWVGVPGEDLGSVKDAGMAVVFPLSYDQPAKIINAAADSSRYQGLAPIGSQREAGDRFGASLAGSPTTMLVGVPGEDVGTTKDAGMFHAVVKGVSSAFTAGAGGVPGSSETGDQLGTTLAIMAGSCVDGSETWAIGAPMEDLTVGGKALADAGDVVLADRGTNTWLTLLQGAGGLPGTPVAGDQFGAALNATGTTNRAKPFLAIGAPLEDVGSVKNAGQVTTLTTDCPGGKPAAGSVTTWVQGGALGDREAGNHFGASIGAVLVLEGTPAAGTLHYRLLVDAPAANEDTGDGKFIHSGKVLALPAAADGFTATGSTYFGQETVGVPPGVPGTGEQGDAFGQGLSANSSR